MKIRARYSPVPMLQGLPHPLIWHRKVRVLSHQSWAALCEPMDCGPPGSSVHRILQARILGWAATPFSRGPSRPRDWTWVSHRFSRQILHHLSQDLAWKALPDLALLLFASTSLHVLPLTLVKAACFSPRTTTPCPPLCWHACFSLTFLSLATVTWLAPVCSSRLNPGVTVSRKFAFPLIPRALWLATHFGLPAPAVQTSTWTLSTVSAIIGQQRSAPLAWSSSKAGRVLTPVCGHNTRHRADHITGTRETLAECRRKPFTNKFCFKCPWHNCALPLLMRS